MKKKRKILSIILILIAILLSIIYTIMARYRSKATATAEGIEIAYYVLDTDYQTRTLNVGEMLPSEETYDYIITVTNEKDGIISETAMDYTVNIKTTTNLPLKYTLTDETGSKNQVDSMETIQDENGVYYLNFKTASKELGLEKETHKYILSIEFPIEYKANSEYADIIELVEITVDSKQKI